MRHIDNKNLKDCHFVVSTFKKNFVEMVVFCDSGIPSFAHSTGGKCV